LRTRTRFHAQYKFLRQNIDLLLTFRADPQEYHREICEFMAWRMIFFIYVYISRLEPRLFVLDRSGDEITTKWEQPATASGRITSS
jgi:hypothetical protein